MKIRSYCSFIILLFSILILGACQQEEQFEELQLNQKEIDVQEVDRFFKKYSNEDKLRLIEKLFNDSHKNQSQLDNWLQKNVIDNYSHFKFRQSEALKAALLSVDQTHNSELSAQFAFQIYSDKRGVILAIKPSACAVLVYHYDLKQEKDSVQKYLHLLGQHLKYDPDSWLRVSYLINKASLASKASRNLDALMSYMEALKYTSPKELNNLRIIHLNLALLYLKFDATEKARYHIRKARSFGVNSFPLDLLNILGRVLSKTKEFQLADEPFERALAVADQKGIPILKAQTLANFANHRRREKRFSEALHLMEESDSICRALGIEVGVLINQINRAELFLDQGNFEVLATTLDALGPKILALAEPSYILDYYRMRYKLYDAIGNEEQANWFYRKYKALHDEKIGDRSRSLLSEWELAQVEVEQEKDKLQLDVALSTQKYTKLIFSFAFAILLFGASIVFIFYLRRSNQRRLAQQQIQQRLAFDLELKSKELLTESLKNISIQQLKQDINSSLGEVLQQIPKSHHEKFEEINRLLKTATSNNFLNEFETRFNSVHEEFYVKLRVLTPELTPHELKICALLRLNISSKEMASLTNRTLGTIDNTRSSIRKKLNLDDSVNLQDYILSL